MILERKISNIRLLQITVGYIANLVILSGSNFVILISNALYPSLELFYASNIYVKIISLLPMNGNLSLTVL